MRRRSRKMLKNKIRAYASYPRSALERGTESLYTSKHFESMRTHYSKKNLRANFMGPREWHFLARRKQERLMAHNPVSSHSVKHALDEASRRAPDTVEYPQPEGVDAETWSELRSAMAHMHPQSEFDREERVIDAWNFMVNNETTRTQHPPALKVHGLPISLRDQYAHEFQPPVDRPEGVSGALYGAYEILCGRCNPWKPENALPADFLRQVIEGGLSTRGDVEFMLPEIVKRWRWLCTGSMLGSTYTTPDISLTCRIIQECVDKKCPTSALQMLRHKSVYKLSPDIASIEQLMKSLMERHVTISKSEESQTVPGPRPAAPVDPTTGKRKLTADEWEYRGNPRFYFYTPLPHVLNPEPQADIEFELPSLPKNNATRRLLPDDQRKMMHILQTRAQEKLTAETVDESPAVESLSDMYRLFHYATSKSPMYYGLNGTSSMLDILIEAGISGGNEEGKQRSGMLKEQASR